MTDKIEGGQIFSLEIQFGDVELNENFESNDPDGVLSVRAKFLNYPTIEINENDFCKNCTAGSATFSKGKHLLLSFQDKELKSQQNCLVVYIKVLQTFLPEDLLPVMKLIGFTSVNIARTFRTLISKVESGAKKECPAVKMLSDLLEIIDPDTGSIIGTLHVYIRLKAFGNCIVTAMQDFADNKGQILEKCFSSKDVVDDDNMGLGSKGPNGTIILSHRKKDKNGQQVCTGNEQSVMGRNQNDPNIPNDVKQSTNSLKKDKSLAKKTKKEEMKTHRSQPPDDQIIQMISIPQSIPKPYQGPLTGQQVDETADVYFLSVTKRNTKTNTQSTVEMEVRVPKTVPEAKERFTHDAQYSVADIQPPPAAKKK